MNNDLISREALKKTISKEIHTNDISMFLKLLSVIDNAPTVETHDTVNMYCDKDAQIIIEQIRPQGEWIETEYQRNYEGGANLTFKGWQCSNCGFERHRKRGMSKFCENCGAKMKGGAE